MVKNIGQLIRKLRKNAGLSQLELELEIDAAQGSLSRIENGEVNPTKETIHKLINILNPNILESSELLGVPLKDIYKLIKISGKLNNSLELNEILQYSVNDLCLNLNLLSAFIVLVKENRLYAETTTQTWHTKISLKTIGVPFNSLFVSLEKDTNNLMVKPLKKIKYILVLI